MKKLELLDQLGNEKTGGFGFRWDDLNFMQEGTLEAIKAVMAPVGNCILTGCVTTVLGSNTGFSVTEGYIFYEGEVYHVPAQNDDQGLNQPDPLIELKKNYQIAGNRSTQNSGSVQIHALWEGVLHADYEQSEPTFINLSTLKRYDDKLVDLISPLLLSKRVQANNFQMLLQDGWPTINLNVMKSLSGIVTVNGGSDGSGATGDNIMQLPAGFRPPVPVVDIALPASGGSTVSRISIGTNGIISTTARSDLSFNIAFRV